MIKISKNDTLSCTTSIVNLIVSTQDIYMQLVYLQFFHKGFETPCFLSLNIFFKIEL